MKLPGTELGRRPFPIGGPTSSKSMTPAPTPPPHERGCVVSFNSTPDHARRERKPKYGRLSETEALKFVTLNPAKQLGIDKWVGSLEVGKDADLAIWSTNPLDYRTLCQQTWIDGRLYYEFKRSREREKSRLKEKRLVAHARKSLGEGGAAEASEEAKEKFFRHSLETACDLFPHSCRSLCEHAKGGAR